MKKVIQTDGKSKVKTAKAVEVMGLMEDGTLDLDSKVALVHEPITLGLMHIKETIRGRTEKCFAEK